MGSRQEKRKGFESLHREATAKKARAAKREMVQVSRQLHGDGQEAWRQENAPQIAAMLEALGTTALALRPSAAQYTQHLILPFNEGTYTQLADNYRAALAKKELPFTGNWRDANSFLQALANRTGLNLKPPVGSRSKEDKYKIPVYIDLCRQFDVAVPAALETQAVQTPLEGMQPCRS